MENRELLLENFEFHLKVFSMTHISFYLFLPECENDSYGEKHIEHKVLNHTNVV